MPELAAVEERRAPVDFATEDESDDAAEPASRWQGHEKNAASQPAKTARYAWKWLLLLIVLLAPLAVVGVLAALPYLAPKDPRELVAKRYLQALSRGDLAEANRLSAIANEHPRNITRVEQVNGPQAVPAPIRGPFAGLRQFHSEIAAKYTYNESRGRFEPNDPLAIGLEALSRLEQHERKGQEQAKPSNEPPKKYSNPEEKALDEVINTYGAMAEIAKGASGLLSSSSLGPTYEDLLNRTTVPLTDAERKLAHHYMNDPAKWRRLLEDRPFIDLPDLGEFELYDIELTATIRTEGQSLGEPGRPIKLRLVRFVLGSIDTGWRVWHAQ